MRPMQELAYQKRGEPYLLIKSPPASGKSRALMFIASDKLANQGLKQAIVVVPERSIGGSFHDEPKWNLCDAPANDNGFRFAMEKFGPEVSDDRLIAVDDDAAKRALRKFRYDLESAKLSLN